MVQGAGFIVPGSVPGSGVQKVLGSRVLRAVLLAVLATAVLPPLGAWWLNHRRIEVTTERLLTAVERVNAAESGQILCGPGRMPDIDVMGAHSVHLAWITAAVSRPEAFGGDLQTDAWGRCFLVNERWILSAGPNGVVDTALTADSLAADDIGVRLRTPVGL